MIDDVSNDLLAIQRSLNKPALLLTGAAGFLGRFVARIASERGWLVHGVDLTAMENSPTMSSYRQLRLPDARLADDVKKTKPTFCVHCAGSASVAQSLKDPLIDFEAGPPATAQLLEALRQHAPECRLIFLSSAAVYGNPSVLPVNEMEPAMPISPYGFHKWQCELLCREYAEVFGLRTASVRIFSAYGAGLRRQVLWDICRQLLRGESLRLRGTGDETRDFIHAHDIARGLLHLAEHGPLKGEVYNLANGRETSVRQLAELATASLGRSIQPSFDGVVPRGDPVRWCADTGKLKGFGFAPEVTLEQGVKSYAEWCDTDMP